MRNAFCWFSILASLILLSVAPAFAAPAGPYTVSVGSGAGSLSITSAGSFGNVDGDNATFDNGTDPASTTVWNLCYFIYDETNAAQYFLEDVGFTRTGSPYPTDGTISQPDSQSLTNVGMGFPSSAGLTADMSLVLSQPTAGDTAQALWTYDFSNSGGSPIDLKMTFFIDQDSYIDTNDYFDDVSAIVPSSIHAGAAVSMGNISGSDLNQDDGILMESVDQIPDRVYGISDTGGASFYWSSQGNFVGIGVADANGIDDSIANTVQNDADVNYLADTGNDVGGVIQISFTVPAGDSISRSFSATWGLNGLLTEGQLPAPPPPPPTPIPIVQWYVLDDLIETAGPTSVGTRQAGTAIIGDDFYIVGGNSETAGDTDAVWRVVISGVTAGAAISETTLPADDFVYISDSTANTDTHLYVAGGGWNSSVPTLWDRAHSIEVLPDGSLDGGGWVASAVFPNGYVHQLGGAVIPDNGFLYVFGGQDDNTATFYDDCYYAEIMGDGSLGPWQTGSDLPQATWFTGSTSIGNSIIVAAGTTTGSGAGALDEVWVCDVNPDGTMGSWTVQTETLPAARYGAKLVAVGDDVLAIGGRDTAGGSSSQDNVWRAPFDSGTSTVGAWTTVDAQLPFGVHYHDAVYSPDEERIYILAGQSGGTAHTNQLISSSHLFAGAVTAVQDWSLFE